MKKLFKLFALAALMWLPWTANGQGSIIVADGTETNGYVPVYGFYADAYLRSQSVYPTTVLTGLTAGSNIVGMTFYASNDAVSWGSAVFEVKLGEVSDATLSAFSSEATSLVYTGSLEIVNGEMAVEFDTPYAYTGGNLLLEVNCISTGSYVSCSFYGISSTGSSYQGYDYSSWASISGSSRDFLPKVNIDYTGGTPLSCFRVANLHADRNRLASAVPRSACRNLHSVLLC